MAAAFPMKKNVARIAILATLFAAPWAMAQTQTSPTLHWVPIRHVETAYILRLFGVDERAPVLPIRGNSFLYSRGAMPQGVSELGASIDPNFVVFKADEKAAEEMIRTLEFLDQPRVAYDIEWSLVTLGFNNDRSFFGPIYEEMQRQNRPLFSSGGFESANIFFPIGQGELERWKAAKRAGIIAQGRLQIFTNENAFIDVESAPVALEKGDLTGGKVVPNYILRFGIRASQRISYASPSPFSPQDENAFALEISDPFVFDITKRKPEPSYVPSFYRGGYLHTDEDWAASFGDMKSKNESTVPLIGISKDLMKILEKIKSRKDSNESAWMWIFKAHKVIVDRENNSKPKEIPKTQEESG